MNGQVWAVLGVLVAILAVTVQERRDRRSASRKSAPKVRSKVKDHTYTPGGQATRDEPWGSGDVCRVCGNLPDACLGRK